MKHHKKRGVEAQGASASAQADSNVPVVVEEVQDQAPVVEETEGETRDKPVEPEAPEAAPVAAPEVAPEVAAPVAAPVVAEIPGLMSVPVTTPEKGDKGNGEVYFVWGKKDFSGKMIRMVGKVGDKVINKGDEVIDETGQKVHLVRVHRGKRVWYGKSPIPQKEAAVVETPAEAVTE